MKYRAQQFKEVQNEVAGKWAVWTGKRYYKDTLTDSKAEAQEQAIIKSMQYHHWEAHDLFDKLCKLYPSKYTQCGSSVKDRENYGDMNC